MSVDIQLKGSNSELLFPITTAKNVKFKNDTDLEQQMNQKATINKTLDIAIESTQQKIDRYNNTLKENNSNNRIRVGSFNILSFRDKSLDKTTKIAYTFLQNNIDVCGIQEFIQHYDFDSSKWLSINNVIDNIHFSELFLKSGARVGNAIISSHSFLTKTVGYYPVVENYEPRGWLAVSFNINGKIIKVYNTHFTHDSSTLLKDQAVKLAATISQDTTTDYKIITGDFNSRTLSEYQPLLDLGYQASFDISKSIDNVLYPSNMRLITTETIDTITDGLSDHNLIIAELEVI